LLIHPTIDQLTSLGLGAMARAFAELQDNPMAAGLDHAEWLALLLEREATERADRRLSARLRQARLRQRATIEDVVYRASRGLDRSLLQRLIAGDWIAAAQNLIIEPASAKAGSPVRLPTRPAVTTTPFSISASPGCPRSRRSPAAMAAIRG
jgi:ATP-dependent exoDNAse (exonuclease V) alpha subunit